MTTETDIPPALADALATAADEVVGDYAARLRRAKRVASTSTTDVAEATATVEAIEAITDAPADQHGPIMTERHWRIAQTDPRHCTAHDLDDLALALEAAGRRLDAQEAQR